MFENIFVKKINVILVTGIFLVYVSKICATLDLSSELTPEYISKLSDSQLLELSLANTVLTPSLMQGLTSVQLAQASPDGFRYLLQNPKFISTLTTLKIQALSAEKIVALTSSVQYNALSTDQKKLFVRNLSGQQIPELGLLHGIDKENQFPIVCEIAPLMTLAQIKYISQEQLICGFDYASVLSSDQLKAFTAQQLDYNSKLKEYVNNLPKFVDTSLRTAATEVGIRLGVGVASAAAVAGGVYLGEKAFKKIKQRFSTQGKIDSLNKHIDSLNKQIDSLNKQLKKILANPQNTAVKSNIVGKIDKLKIKIQEYKRQITALHAKLPKV